MPCRTLLRLVVVALLLAAAGPLHAAPQELREAWLERPGGAAQAVALPDEQARAPGEAAPFVRRYRFVARLDEPRGQALYLPGLIAHARIVVNGHVLADTLAEAGAPLPRSARRIRLLPVPDEFLQAGPNEVLVEATAMRVLSVSPLWIGPAGTLARQHDRRVLGVVIGPALVATSIACLGLCVLVLWARRREETLYGYFGGGALGWGLHSAWTVLPEPLLRGVHLGVWWTALYSFFVMLLVVFCLRFAGWRWPRAERALWAAALAAPALLYAAEAAGVFAPAAEAWRAAWLAVVALAVGAVGRHAWRQRDTGSALLLASGAVSLAFGLRDWTVAHRWLDNHPVYLTPYAGLLFIALVAWMLVDAFVAARRALEEANASLEERVARKGAELRRALEAMRAARDAAEAADRAKSRFLAVASHDLRQPVHALGLYLAAVGPGAPPHLLRDTLRRMGASVAALQAMFDALLDLTRIDAGAVVPHPAPLDLAALLRRLGDEFAPQAERRGLRLALHGAGAAPVVADALLLERIVRNLLSNALKFTRAGGVLLAWRRRAGAWRVEVWDTGCGIAPGEQPQAFEEFRQLGAPGAGDGLGLGLAIVRRLARLMDLPLALHSVPGRGTRVVLTLPAAVAAPAAAPDAVLPPLAAGHWVALLEDDTQGRHALQRLLQAWGCRCVQGGALDTLLVDWQRAGRPAIAALVADVQLGAGASGPEAVAQLRGLWERPGLPALLVTGASTPELIERLDAGGMPWLVKPVPAPRLRAWLADALHADVEPA